MLSFISINMLKRITFVILLFFITIDVFAESKCRAYLTIGDGTITRNLLNYNAKLNITDGIEGTREAETLYFKNNFSLKINEKTAEIKFIPKLNSDLFIKNLYLNYKKYIGDFNIIDDFDYGTHNEWLPYKGSFPSDRNTLLRCVDDATYYGYKVKYYDLKGDEDLWIRFKENGELAILLDPEILSNDANTIEISFILNVNDALDNNDNYNTYLEIYFKKTNEITTTTTDWICHERINLNKIANTGQIKISANYLPDYQYNTLYVNPNTNINISIRLNRSEELLEVYINNIKMSSQPYSEDENNIQQIWFSRNTNYWKDIYINDLKIRYYQIYPQQNVSIRRLLDYAGSYQSLITFSTNEIMLDLLTQIDTLEVANIISNNEIINIAKDVKINDINIKSNIILNYQEDLGFTDDFESGVADDSLTDSEYLSSDGMYDIWQYKYNSPKYTDEAALSSNLAISGDNTYYKAILKKESAITKEVIFSFDAKVEAGHTYLCYIVFDNHNFNDNGTINGTGIETYIYTDTGNGRVRVGNSYIDSAVDITDGQFHRYTYIINHAEHSFDLYVDNVYCGQTSITSSYNQTKAFKIEFDSYNTIIDNVSFFEKMEQKSSIKCITNNGEKNVIQPINDTDIKSDFRFLPFRLTLPIKNTNEITLPTTGEVIFCKNLLLPLFYDGNNWKKFDGTLP